MPALKLTSYKRGEKKRGREKQSPFLEKYIQAEKKNLQENS